MHNIKKGFIKGDFGSGPYLSELHDVFTFATNTTKGQSKSLQLLSLPRGSGEAVLPSHSDAGVLV